MTTLSICIPVEPGSEPPVYLVKELLRDGQANVDIVVAPYGETCAQAAELYSLAAADRRLRILPPAPENISAAQLWIGTIAAATGDWVTIVRPQDMIEPDLPLLLAHIEATMPEVNAYGWNSFQIAADASRRIKTAVAVPIQHHSMNIEKDTMLDAFFQWTDSGNTPKMPFGIFHCALKRSLVDTVLGHSSPSSWLTPTPQYEWAARTVLFADQLGFSSRPLSASNAAPYRPIAVRSAIEGFPFDGSIGLTAAIAEIQCRVLREFGAEWTGFNENFIRACMLDCIGEHDPDAFENKCQAYYAAIGRMEGGRLASHFRPPYLSEPQADVRRGLFGRTVLVDRFIGNAHTAQEFFTVIRGMIAPIAIIKERPDELIVQTDEHLALSA